MKKLLAILFVFTTMVLSTVTAYAISGNGTEESPFLITNQAELDLITDYPSSYFKLANDIVMTKEMKKPLCYESANQTFEGVFDGDGYTISNLIINDSDFSLSGVALFNGNEGTIKNLNILDGYVRGLVSIGLAVENSGEILNCAISANIGGGPGDSIGITGTNSGTISGCTVSGRLLGTCNTFGIADTNSGTISNCVISTTMAGVGYAAGVCERNYGTISECEFSGTLESHWGYDHFAGIAIQNGYWSSFSPGTVSKCKVQVNIDQLETIEGIAEYAAGICCENYDTIEDCYFIGSLQGERVGGITVENGAKWYSGGEGEKQLYGKVENCYVVSTFECETDMYPIASTVEYEIGIIENCFYDRTVSGISDNTNGTPMSTTGMKMKQTYQDTWDFDIVWSIDENINDGYPYLLWEYPEVETISPYTVNSVRITDLAGNELDEIPDSNFYFEANVTKNDNSENIDSLIIAVYDEDGAFIGLNFMKGTYHQNKPVTFGTMINKTDKKIGNIKAFVWDSVFGMKPLSNEIAITN